MHCEKCKKNEATVHYTEVVNDKVQKLHLCEDCALSEGIGMHPPFSIGDLVGGLTLPKISPSTGIKKSCSLCGMTLTKFKQTGRLGCYHCYDTFKKELTPLFASIHKSTKHIGKIPPKAEKVMETVIKVRRLELRLQEAVRMEEYELAAKLRDEIKTLERKSKNKEK